MNYYERFLGDYGKKTAGLTLAEHGAYTLMLDTYYSTEAPLPGPLDELYRVCRAMTKAEREAVDKVAGKFFPVADDGLRHNQRADEEIEKARARIESARANGKHGGRPKKNPTGSETATEEEPNGLADGNPMAKLSMHHAPLTAKSKALVRSKPRTQQLEAPTEEHEQIAAQRGVSCQAEFAAYRDWLASTGKRHKDEAAGFRNWLRRAKPDIAGELAARKLQAARNMDIITGKVRHDGPIDGIAARMDRAPVFALPSDLREPAADDVEGRGPGRTAAGLG